MLAVVLAVGIVVDDAIVVVEAVEHHIQHGLSPLEATEKAMEEVSGPVVAIGLVLCAVFVPVSFMGGIVGQLYRQFAITISVSVILSVIVALTLTPALCAMLLRPRKEIRGPLGAFLRGFNKVFDKTTNGYLGGVGFFLRRCYWRSMPRGIVVWGRDPPYATSQRICPERRSRLFFQRLQSSRWRFDGTYGSVDEACGSRPKTIPGVEEGPPPIGRVESPDKCLHFQ